VTGADAPGVGRTFVVGTDGSPGGTEAVRTALKLARLVGARVHVVCAYREAQWGAEGGGRQAARRDVSAVHDDAKQVLDRTLRRIRTAGVDVTCHARAGNAGDVLVDVADEEGAELLVVGNRGMSGFSRFLLGSVPNRVSHHANCSVMIVRTT
jgi:nucleotide-binding universal stress UspA family protein